MPDTPTTSADSSDAGLAPERFPYGSKRRYHLQHTHLFATDLDSSIAFYTHWFDAEVMWDGNYGGARNVFMRIGIGALHFYEQPPREKGRNAVHHLGMQIVGLDELHGRMLAAGLAPNPVRRADGSAYFMLQAPDGVLLELFEPGPGRDATVLRYYGLAQAATPAIQP